MTMSTFLLGFLLHIDKLHTISFNHPPNKVSTTSSVVIYLLFGLLVNSILC